MDHGGFLKNNEYVQASLLSSGRLLVGIALLSAATATSFAADLREPLTLASENGALNILMVAKASPVYTIPGSPIGWVYEICKRPLNGAVSCPSVAGGLPNYYGGTLLRLQQGDHLKVRLVNQLPLALDSKHAGEPGREFLTLNPTNIHTHGLLVSPRGPSATDPTYGDNVFILTFNSANGRPVASPHMHSDIRYDFTDYDIRIPDTHPSGLFWFHPHAHGVALNQVSAGLAGLITVGSVTDYLCKERGCASFTSKIGVRHMMFKDAQILPTGDLQDQEDPNMCAPVSQSGEGPRHGSCAGQDQSGNGGPNYTNGKWFFTVNGQTYPTVPVKASGGEVWRLANTSGSVTYDLNLWNPAQNRNMLAQILSIDGVSVSPTKGITKETVAEINGGKFKAEACPGVEPAAADNPFDEPICTRTLHMMPSSRMEIWVSYRTPGDALVSPPQGAFAVLRSNGYQTGPTGDSWPAVDLARVEFQVPIDAAMPKALRMKGEAIAMLAPTALANSMATENAAVPPDASCHALPPGHMRRLFYAVPTSNLNAFGLAYEEVDEFGHVVGTPATDVIPFDPMKATICLPLGPGNSPAVERWQIINVAMEDHNFHIHQTRFRVLSKDELAGGTALPVQIFGKGIVLDNIPLPHATGTCGNNPPDDISNPIADWRAGLCNAPAITVEIPFAVAGDFVYHCHILEHEDGGMMARIRVRPNR